MKNRQIRAVVTALAITLASCQGDSGKTEDLKAVQRERDQYHAELEKQRATDEAQRQYIADTTQVLNEVQDSVADIRRNELKVVRITAVAGQEGWVREPQKQSILQDITSIREALHTNQGKLARLEEQARSSAHQIAGLKSFVARLQQTIAEQESEIAELQTTVEGLQAEIREKDAVIREQGEQITDRDKQIEHFQAEARTGYVLVGSGEELERIGVAKARRGAFGFRRYWQLARDLDPQLFHEVDIEQTLEIPVESPIYKVELLSPHPFRSYSLDPAGPAAAVLRIKDPKSFWQFRFLVILKK
ncbi:MAG TPA: hypothetical protein VIA62_00880 [Thermoanaerobaculia bacterium]|jgi:DNA repair exonuclease SbcCD ATPase subunit|nr:hypothetical protein [Thermoanaerobaculia bacterium]